MAETTSYEYRCGFCLSSYEYMSDPRTLDCSHSFCLRCLKGDLQVYKRVECPECKVVVPSGRELDSLPQAQMNQTGAAEGTCSYAPSCDSCVIEERTNQAIAKFFCETCNMKFCATHDQMHQGFFGKNHSRKSITEYLEAPDKFKPQYCSSHSDKELSLACESCLKVLCVDCDLTSDVCTSTGRVPHQLKSFTVLSARLYQEYDEALKNLNDKSKAICKLEKLAWRRLELVTAKSEKMLEEVDKATEEQIVAIRECAEALKQEIKEYIVKCNGQTEAYSQQMLLNLKTVDEKRADIRTVVKKTHLSDLIRESRNMTANIKTVTNLNPDKFLLEEKALYKTGENRKIEVGTRSTIPNCVNVQRTVSPLGNQPTCATILSSDQMFIGNSTNIQIVNPQTGAIGTSINCSGLIQLSSFKQNVYALVNVKGAQMVRQYSADLQASTDILTRGSGALTSLTVTGGFIVLVDNPSKLLRVYDLNGAPQLDLSMENLPSQITCICSLDEEHVLVVAGNRLYCFALAGDSFPAWTSDPLAGGMQVCCDKVTGYIYALSGLTVYLLSPDGKYINNLQIGNNQYNGSAAAVCVYDRCLCAAGYFNQRRGGGYLLLCCNVC